MAEIQQFDLGRVMQQAGTINAQRRQNRLLDLMAPYQEREVARNEQRAVAQDQDADLRRKALYSKLALGIMGDDFAELPDEQKQTRFSEAMQALGEIGAPKEWRPEKFEPGIYNRLQQLSNVYGMSQSGVQSTYIDDQGNRIAIMRDGSTKLLGKAEDSFQYTPEGLAFSRRGGTVQTPGAAGAPLAGGGGGQPASGQDLITEQKQRQAQLDAEAAAKKREAEILAEVNLAPQVASAEASIEGARQGAGTSAKSNIETLNAYVDAGQDAVRGLAPVTRAIELLERVETGGLQSEWGLRLRQLTGSESADQGELSNLLGKSVLAQLKPVFGSAFTAAEGERLTNIEASFGRSPATNRRLLQNALDIMRDAAERGARAARKRGDDFTAEEIERKLEAFSSGRDQATPSQRPPQRQPAPAQPPRPAQLPATNAKGWRLMTDAKGNRAYVSPDGRQYEEVR
ncbi:MAG: hypothetical protein ACLGH6_01960 [Gammaproteobacteria bacterium]